MNIRRGSSGNDVVRIQNILGLTPDGVFGPMTEREVNKWKLSKGLPTNGVIDSAAWNIMFPTSTTNSVNLDRLKGHIPDKVLLEIPLVIEKFKINTSSRMAHFLGQCSHESGGFTLVVENMNYSASQLAKTWPKRFSVDHTKLPLIPNELARRIERNPQLIANTVYSNRMGNGSPETNEGFNFRGRGYIQLTGKSNYTAFNGFVEEDVIKNPNLVSIKYPLLSAGWFFHTNRINHVSDRGVNNSVISQVTEIINGGQIHIQDRINRTNMFHNLLS
jgi:putative chitinase